MLEVTYILYWGVYLQWTKRFATEEAAIDAAKKYISSKDANGQDFRLIKQVEVPVVSKILPDDK